MFTGIAPVPISASTEDRRARPDQARAVASLRQALAEAPETGADALLARSGCLDPRSVEGPAWLLRETAALDLSLARLLEGHVNALALIRIHGDEALRGECLREAAEGHLFGVWGADADPPVAAEDEELTGAKRYASGLGLVSRAIVTARSPEGQRMFVVDASERRRHDPAAWEMSGMQDSRSGRFDCDGLLGRPLGAPDSYTLEPHFVGGTWRIAAVTAGGIVGLLDRAAAALRGRGHLESDAQLLRLGPVAGRVVAAWPAILRAGDVASGSAGLSDPDRAATLSVSTRLLTEDLGQDAIAAVERSLGLAMFATEDPAGRMARDLACYMRQVGRDAFALRTARAFLGGATLGAWLDG